MERVLIMGAAGRDFHDFNTVFRGRDDVRVVAFTRAPGQNLGEADRELDRYPSALAGDGYPDGIPIYPEADLESLIKQESVDRVVFSYSDVSHDHVMSAASCVLAAGAEFGLIGEQMMLDIETPVIAVDAVRTGCGKSQVARALTDELRDRGVEVAVVREPMPYGDLEQRRVQRFASMDDLDAANVTIEEREEYEQHIERGHTVFAGVDYADVFAAAAREADLLVWDGGNNELPFAVPDVHLVLCDPLRAGDERSYHPGETNLRRADEVLVAKENSASTESIQRVVTNARELAPDARLVHTDSVVSLPDEVEIAGERVLCVEDGPTLTHGEASHGAAYVAASDHDATPVDPREYTVGSLESVFEEYDHLGPVLPAMGYSDSQIADLEATIAATDCAYVLAGTPHDLGRVLDIDTPVVDVQYRTRLKGDSYAALLDRHADALGLS